MSEVSAEFIRAAVQSALITANSGLTVTVSEVAHGAAGPVYAIAFRLPEAEPTT